MKKRKWGCFLLLVLLSLLIIGGIVGYAYFKVKGTADAIHEPISGRSKSDLRDEEVSIKNNEAISVALFGVDSDKNRLATGDAGRSDSIILLSINPEKKKTVMISIPRDTYSEMVGKGDYEKINHAYSYGGPDMAVKSVEKLMGVPIDYYATINMDGMKEMIDTLGGIDVTSNATFNFGDYHFVEGQKAHLDGDAAMAFIRSRKENGAGGDFGRQERQQLVIQGLAQKAMNVGTVTKLDSILKTVKGNVVTDVTFSELTELRNGYAATLNNVDKYQLEGTGQVLDDGLWYFMADDAQKKQAADVYLNNLK